MKKEEICVAKILFQNRIYEYKGQAFEDFFVSVMTKYNQEFQAVKAYGNIGDQKNDGFVRSTGTYYQVFSPEDITKDKTIKEALRKLETDLKGLFEKWNDICKIKKFYFVINDKYNGIPAPIIQKVIELDNSTCYENVEIAVFTAKDLEKIFMELDEVAMQDVVGFIPDVTFETIEYDALNEVVKYLLNTELPENDEGKLIVPDFYEKIQFNDLSKEIENKLMMGSYQEGILKTYFNENPGMREILQGKFHALYEKSCELVADTKENAADCRFYYILENAAPRKTMAIYTCIGVLMSYYFTTCDIFEEPK